MKSMIPMKSRLAEFSQALTAGIEGIVKASNIYVEALDADPKAHDAFADKFADQIPSAGWSRFEAVGRKWIHPRMLMGGCSDSVKNTAVKRLPYSIQERIFERGRFPLLTSSGDTLQVDVLEATREQVMQLIDGKHVRTLSEQKAWMEARATQAVASGEKYEVLPYVILHGKLEIRRGTVLSKAEVKRILMEM